MKIVLIAILVLFTASCATLGINATDASNKACTDAKTGIAQAKVGLSMSKFGTKEYEYWTKYLNAASLTKMIACPAESSQ